MTDSNIDANNIWHPFTSLNSERKNLVITSAKGVWLNTADGRKILDAISSWWVNIHGHGNEIIAEAIYKQCQELDHIIFAGFTHPPAIRLTEKLLSILDSSYKRIFFSDNGSTAVEVALKMAIQFWHNQGISKKKIIAFEGGYHGDTFGAMSVGGRSRFNAPFHELLFDVDFLPFPEKGKEELCLQQMKSLCRNPDTAAFIYEPLIQGTAGMRTYTADTLDALMSIAREHNILLISDEVMTGFGRTGKVFASDYCKNKPDLICLSKGITGGILPLGLTICNEEIEKKFIDKQVDKTFFHGHSYTGNAISCAAALASLNILLSPECKSDIERISESHKRLEKRISGSKKIKGINRLGTIIAIEFESREQTGYFNNLRDLMYDFFLDKDILLRPLGNIIYIMPPYIISDEDLEKIYNAIENLLEKL